MLKMGNGGFAGSVYAAREDGTPLIKIGCTSQREARHRVHQLRFQFHVTFTLLGEFWVPRGVRLLERALHAKLAAEHIEREFFYLPMNQAIFQALVDAVLPEVCRELHALEAEREEFLVRFTEKLRSKEAP